MVIEYKKDSHEGAVLSLSWNKHYRQALSSGSADNTVKIWVSNICTSLLEYMWCYMCIRIRCYTVYILCTAYFVNPCIYVVHIKYYTPYMHYTYALTLIMHLLYVHYIGRDSPSLLTHLHTSHRQSPINNVAPRRRVATSNRLIW